MNPNYEDPLDKIEELLQSCVANKLELLDDKSQEILLDEIKKGLLWLIRFDFVNTIHKFREALKECDSYCITKDGNEVKLVDFFSDKELFSVFVPNIDITIKEVV